MTALKRATAVTALALLITGCSDATAPLGPSEPGLRLSLTGPAAVSDAELDALGEAFDDVDLYEVTIVDAQTLDVLVETSITVDAGLDEHVLDISIPEVAFGRPVTIMLVAFDGETELYRSVLETTLGEDAGTVSLDLEIRYTGPGIRGRVADIGGNGVAGVSVNLVQGQAIVDAVTTEEDGTYLFLDVPTGSYRVAPTPPNPFPYICPGARDISVGSADAALVADFLASDDVCGTSVLVVSGGDFDDTPAVDALLQSSPGFTVSTFFFVNQLPSVDLLSQYDVVLLFMNGLFDESSALGTEVAEYVAAGGNVVLASFYWQGRSDSGLGSVGWGELESIDPFLSTGGATYQAGTLGTVTAHPLTSGLAGLTSSSGYRGGATARAGTSVVATWDDGTPLIGYRILSGGQRITGVTLFPAAGPSVTGDVQVLWENAVSWTGAAGGPVP